MDRVLVTGLSAQDHAKTGRAADIPGVAEGQFISIAPVVLQAPNRFVDLQLRVTVPSLGANLPIVLLSHGEGTTNNVSSLNGYAPLAQYYATQGFAVFQPTHLTSRSHKLPENTPRPSLLWYTRAEDMTYILDHLQEIESSVPLIQGRLDHRNVAAVGHSIGGHTIALLLGLRVGEEGRAPRELRDARIKAGVIIGAPGAGGQQGLTSHAWEKLLFLREPDYSAVAALALVVGGDADNMASLTTRGPLWWADSYHLSPGPKDLLTFFGGRHELGGIVGWDSASDVDGGDENPETVAAVQRMTLAYLRSIFYPGDDSWKRACEAFEKIGDMGKVERK